MIQKDTVADIEKIIDEMEEPYKEVFKLRHYGELSYDEISAMYKKTAGWARIIFYRAKKKILEKMEELNYE